MPRPFLSKNRSQKSRPCKCGLILICGVTVRQNFKPPMETFCVRHWVQISILFENSLSFKILCFSLALSSQHSAPKVIAKIESLGFKSWLSVCNYVQLMATVKLKICFDSGQFVGGAKNLQGQCAVVIYAPKSSSNWLTLLVNFGKFRSSAANCSEIYAIS